jgi:UDP-2,4-diacetamido-2,4,6-trideoxy-beta-L-altropyranose hydrolase
MKNKIVIRADASLLIGTGHVMRCLTLAQALRNTGHEVVFISRLHEGHLCDHVEAQGFQVIRLPGPADADSPLDWLGLPWEVDAQQTMWALKDLSSPVAWLIVDHYSLDTHWEQLLRPQVTRILVIDDLADRQHACDFLLDQNLGRCPKDYAGLVPANCSLLVGPSYALLRNEFTEWRERSLARLRWPIRRILISMGGVDRNDATSMVLDALERCPSMANAEINVIMGPRSPWLHKVRTRVAQLKRVSVHVNVANMAEHMASNDLAIGAAGSSSWERCCLGLPTLTVILADNQRQGALAMDVAGVQLTVGIQEQAAVKLEAQLNRLNEQAMRQMSKSASALVDGLGVQRVLEAMINV